MDNEHDIVSYYEEESKNRTQMIAMQRAGGEIEINAERLSIGLNMDNDNDPLPEFRVTFPNMECFYAYWYVLQETKHINQCQANIISKITRIL